MDFQIVSITYLDLLLNERNAHPTSLLAPATVFSSKGSEIKYTKLEMPSYLLPNNEYKIDDQRYVYGMRNKMADIPSSFTAKEKSNQNATAIKLKTLNILYTTVKI